MKTQGIYKHQGDFAFLHGGNRWYLMDEFGIKPEKVIDFSVNINPLGPPEGAKEAIIRAIEKITWYPDIFYRELIKVIAEVNGIEEKLISVGNGATELIYAVSKALKYPSALIICPTFTEYERAVRVCPDRNVFYYVLSEAGDFSLDVEELMLYLRSNMIDRKVKAVFLCNPNNPTGKVVLKREVLNLAYYLKEMGATLIVDESFADFTGMNQEISVIDKAGEVKNLIVIKSLTKFYALPGLRIGFMVADECLSYSVKKILPPWNVNVMAEAAAIASVKDKKYQLASVEFIEEQRKYMEEKLTELGLRVFTSHTNYLLVKLPFAIFALSKQLASKGVLVRNCADFYGLDDTYMRLAVKREEENIFLLELIRDFMEVYYG